MRNGFRVPHRMTVAEFQGWEPPDQLAQRRWELVDGEPAYRSISSVDHGAIHAELGGLLGNWLIAHRPECRVAMTPGVVPRIRADFNERVPDLAVTCGPIWSALMLDAPLLVVEILSPSNEGKTRANVWAYATIPSVHEIFLVSSTSFAAELLRRNADGTWPSDPLFLKGDADFGLDSIGLSLTLRDVYRTSSLAERLA